MKKVICYEVIVDGKQIGIINYSNDENNFTAEVLLNGPSCMSIIKETKTSRNKNTTQVIKAETREELDDRVQKFIEEIIPNVDYKIDEHKAY